MNTERSKAPTLGVRKSIPIQARAEASCSALWENIPTPTEPAEFPTILRLSRRGMRLATIAQSNYYLEMFASLRDATERRMSV